MSDETDKEVRRTRRWRGITGIALFAGAVGVIANRPLVLLLGVVGTAFAAYPQITGEPAVDLELERTLDEDSPSHGDEVEVAVRVKNVGKSILTDLRIVDGVPPMLGVVGGTPRHTAALRPGSTTEFSYRIQADYGRHQFDPATVIARDVSGAIEVETTVSAETELSCTEEVPEVPLRDQASSQAGRMVTDQGGSGIEFFQTREYKHGDPLNRIDWKRAAKTGKLTTVEFREERSTTVIICVDADVGAYRAHGEGEPNAVAYSIAGAEQLLASLSDTRNFVGLAALGRELCWVKPGSGRDYGDRLRQTLANHETLSTIPPRAGTDSWVTDAQRAEFQKRLSNTAQVVLFSPLADDEIVNTAVGLEARGNAVTIISPNVTSSETVGNRLATVERRHRISSLRQSGVPVVDWDPETPLGTELLRSQERTTA